MRGFLNFVLAKPYLILVLAIALAGAGFNAYQNLPLEAYPDIANMQVRIITQVPGKAAEEVERLVTIPLEKELSGIPHASPPRSVSIFGLSSITVVFDDAIAPYEARQQILEHIGQADIPDGLKPQLDPNASPVGEVFRYTIDGAQSPMQRKEVQDWVLNRAFKAVPGVVDVTGFGGPTRTYQILIDQDLMRARHATQAQIAAAISSANGSTGGSFIEKNDLNYMVRGIGWLNSVKDIEKVVIATSAEGGPIRIGDVSVVSVAPAIRKGQVGKNLDDDVVEGIVLMRRGENPSTVIESIRKAWSRIVQTLPEGMKLIPLYDRTALVRNTMQTIGHTIIEGVVLVVVLLMLFFFQVRSALICAVVIPMALLIAFLILNLIHVPVNLLSLGAIDFGILVDGAVIMVESIVSGLEREQRKSQLLTVIAISAANVAKPILFSTVIIFMTFLPVLAFDGVEGKLFRPLAITMNCNLIAAMLATVTLVPVLCLLAYGIRPISHRRSPVLAFLENIYRPSLNWSLRNPLKITAVAMALVVLPLLILPFLGSEFLPELEEGNIWLRATVLPTSVSLSKCMKIAREIRLSLKNYPEVTNVVSQIGAPDDGTDPNTFSNIEVLVDLKPQHLWRKEFPSKQSLVASMRKDLGDKLPSVQYNFSQYIKDNMDEAIGGVKGEFGAKIFGTDLKTLSKLASRVRNIIQSTPGMVDVSQDHLLGQPQVVVSIDRDRADRFGVNSADILNLVETSLGGKAITQIAEGDRRIPVVMRLGRSFRSSPDLLGSVLLTTASGETVPLHQVTTIMEDHGATNILRDVNERFVSVKANIRGRDLGSAVQDAQARITKEVEFPAGYRIAFSGQFDRAQHALSSLCVVVPVTMCLIFLLLYGAFNSASSAILAMVVVPLAAGAGVLALFLTGTHFSISAGVGFIALFGVSIQNAVVLISQIRGLRPGSTSPSAAAWQGALDKMRPVVTGTVVAVAGLLPAAMASGIGSQSQRPFAIVIVGGLLPTAIMTLLVVPSLYQFFEEMALKSRKNVVATADDS